MTSPQEASLIAPHHRHGRSIHLHHQSSPKFSPELEAPSPALHARTTPHRAPGLRRCPPSAPSAFLLKLQRLFPGLSNPPRCPPPFLQLPGQGVPVSPLFRWVFPLKPLQLQPKSRLPGGAAAVGTQSPMLPGTHPLIGLQNTQLLKKNTKKTC